MLHFYYLYSFILYTLWCDEVVVDTWAAWNFCGVDESWNSLHSPRQGILAKMDEPIKGEPWSKVITCCNANCICCCSVDWNSSLIFFNLFLNISSIKFYLFCDSNLFSSRNWLVHKCLSTQFCLLNTFFTQKTFWAMSTNFNKYFNNCFYQNFFHFLLFL